MESRGSETQVILSALRSAYECVGFRTDRVLSLGYRRRVYITPHVVLVEFYNLFSGLAPAAGLLHLLIPSSDFDLQRGRTRKRIYMETTPAADVPSCGTPSSI